jgi:DNA ligase D-like protein (predicted 3'-phosphoesterase)
MSPAGKRRGASKPAVRGRATRRAAPLGEYRKKRHFGRSPEPRGGPSTAKGSELSFVVQRHEASHLHFDLRLEENGILKSWAVPKPPPEIEGIRRLAVATEDHPLEYRHFAGTIPEGEYGAGKVEIWDEGSYAPRERSPVKRVFDLRGGRLRGTYALIKLKPGERRDNNWLFFKMKSGEKREEKS